MRAQDRRVPPIKLQDSRVPIVALTGHPGTNRDAYLKAEFQPITRQAGYQQISLHESRVPTYELTNRCT
ncbi:hypothetical protein DPMN_105678 [Dreissena polymorpha]|uniref:Uncharacterized protein n=1 Tax=Dreissena polymorpha TaxID=45954 RepID=A0A9D4QHV4_DREPO|nr:hypothetical protein DPMN_105603 [Dreissena polymorpha]KAH3832393.1 hypothetical protein DPMN_105678 [Dreissena polymorpha]